jgi:ABC-type phosphate transport system permease subunit
MSGIVSIFVSTIVSIFVSTIISVFVSTIVSIFVSTIGNYDKYYRLFTFEFEIMNLAKKKSRLIVMSKTIF